MAPNRALPRPRRLLAAACLVVAGCYFAGSRPRPSKDTNAYNVPMETVYYSTNTGIRGEMVKVVRDSTTWTAMWDSIHTDRGAVPPAPPVSFAEKMIVIAAMGERATGGYSVAIDSIQCLSSAFDVHLSLLEPGEGCMVTQALSQPVQIVKADICTGTMRVRKNEAVVECP